MVRLVDENEFKKLASNSRDWLIYSLLSEKSKKTVEKDIKIEPKGDTVIEEIITGIVSLVTDKAVLIQVADRVAWFPKSVILNLDKIVLEKDTTVELKIVDWFKYKIEWKVPTQ